MTQFDKAECLDCDWEQRNADTIDVGCHTTWKGHTVQTTEYVCSAPKPRLWQDIVQDELERE